MTTARNNAFWAKNHPLAQTIAFKRVPGGLVLDFVEVFQPTFKGLMRPESS